MTGADAKTTVVTDIFAYVDDQMKHPMTLHSTVASAGYHVLVPSTATGSANTLDRAVQERSRQEPFYSRHSCQDYYCSQCNSLRCLSLRLAFDTVDACLFCALERIAKIGFNEQDLWATSYDEAHKAMIPQINRGIAKWIWKAVSFCRTTFPDHTWKQCR